MFPLLLVDDVVDGFPFMGVEHPLAFFVAEDIAEVVFHVFDVDGQGYIVEYLFL